MATFFGEVVSVYSRAVGSDDEDLDNEEDEEIMRELQEKREVQLEWCPEVKQSMERSGSNVLQCSDFILAVGHNAASFLSVHVLNSVSWEAAGRASLWNERTGGSKGQSSKQPACVFFRHTDQSSNVLICQNTCYTAEDQLFQWTEKVFGCLQKRGLSVTVLSDSPLTDYKTSDYLSSAPFLRSLRTGTYSNKPACPPLEQPNIVTGLTASVLSYCQIHQIPAVAYQCYSDIISPDSVTMETYKPVLTCLGKCIKLDPCPSVDTLRKCIQTSEIQSNLYI